MLKLNNKGQSLVLFIMIIPILLLIMVFVYDMGMLLYEKDRLSNTVNMAMDYALDNKEVSDEEIRDLINKNMTKEVDIKIDRNDDNITIEVIEEVSFIFSNLFDFDFTKLDIEYEGKIVDNKKIIERKWYNGW